MSARRPARRTGSEAGFTLLEIVVALVVLGILLATLSRGVQFGLAAFDRQDRMIDTAGRLEAVDGTLRRLFERLDPGTGSDGSTVTGTHHGIALRSVLPVAALDRPGGLPGSGLADLRLSVDGEHRLLLGWLPHRHVVPLDTHPRPHQEVLLDGVERIDLDYWSNGTWHQTWGEAKPPALIRLRLVFPDGDARRWPDIVAAPGLDQPGG